MTRRLLAFGGGHQEFPPDRGRRWSRGRRVAGVGRAAASCRRCEPAAGAGAAFGEHPAGERHAERRRRRSRRRACRRARPSVLAAARGAGVRRPRRSPSRRRRAARGPRAGSGSRAPGRSRRRPGSRARSCCSVRRSCSRPAASARSRASRRRTAVAISFACRMNSARSGFAGIAARSVRRSACCCGAFRLSSFSRRTRRSRAPACCCSRVGDLVAACRSRSLDVGV